MPEAIDWREVYERLLPRIYHFFCYKTGDPALAEDLSAITLEKAWTGRQNYRSDLGAFDLWVFGIARRVAADHYRRPNREVGLELAQDAAHTGSSLEDEVQNRLHFQRLAALLQKLPERERELIALKYGAGMTNRQIAHLSGLSESNAGTILHRTVTGLRQEWEKEE